VRDRNEKVDEEGRRFEMWRDVEEQRKVIQIQLQMSRRPKILKMKWNKVTEAQAFEM